MERPKGESGGRKREETQNGGRTQKFMLPPSFRAVFLPGDLPATFLAPSYDLPGTGGHRDLPIGNLEHFSRKVVGGS